MDWIRYKPRADGKKVATTTKEPQKSEDIPEVSKKQYKTETDVEFDKCEHLARQPKK